MNEHEYTAAELEALEAQTAAQESVWRALQHVNATYKPNWKQGEEIIKVQGKDSIHGAPRSVEGEE